MIFCWVLTAHSLTHSLTRPPIHPFIHSFTHSITHSLTLSPIESQIICSWFDLQVSLLKTFRLLNFSSFPCLVSTPLSAHPSIHPPIHPSIHTFMSYPHNHSSFPFIHPSIHLLRAYKLNYSRDMKTNFSIIQETRRDKSHKTHRPPFFMISAMTAEASIDVRIFCHSIDNIDLPSEL